MGGHGSHSLDPIKLEAGDRGMDRDWEDELKEEGLTMITGGLTMLTYQKDEKERAEEEKNWQCRLPGAYKVQRCSLLIL